MVDQIGVRCLGDRAVRKIEPVMPVRRVPKYLPGSAILLTAHRPKGFPRCPAALGDHAGRPVGGVDEHKPEVRLVSVQRDAPRDDPGVIVGVREHGEQPSHAALACPMHDGCDETDEVHMPAIGQA